MALRTFSPKRIERLDEARGFRAAFAKRVRWCEGCCRPRKHWARCAVHEIARGPDRHKAQDKTYAILLLCDPGCHQSVGEWPRAKQLALLKLRRPREYDLAAYNALVGRQIADSDVDVYWRKWRADDSDGHGAASGQPADGPVLDQEQTPAGGERGPERLPAEVLPD